MNSAGQLAAVAGKGERQAPIAESSKSIARMMADVNPPLYGTLELWNSILDGLCGVGYLDLRKTRFSEFALDAWNMAFRLQVECLLGGGWDDMGIIRAVNWGVWG